MPTKTRIRGIDGLIRLSRKEHRCDRYFFPVCAGSGKIESGEYFFEPEEDQKEPYHPYRVCSYCVNMAREGK